MPNDEELKNGEEGFEKELLKEVKEEVRFEEKELKEIEEEERLKKEKIENLKKEEKLLEKHEHKEHLIKVFVSYMAAIKPFETFVEPTQTIENIKQLALNEFGLVDGGGKVFNLFYEKKELQNLSETIGQLAEGKKELKFDLDETLVQG